MKGSEIEIEIEYRRSGGLGEQNYQRYVLHRDTMAQNGWVYRHQGPVPIALEDRSFQAKYAGGPRDGETTVFLGAARRWEGTASGPWQHGYVLHHEGPDRDQGWELRWVAAHPDTVPV